MKMHRRMRNVVLALLAIGMAVGPVAAGAQPASAQAPTSASVSAAVPGFWPFPNTCGGRAYAPPGAGLSWGNWTNSTCVKGGYPGAMLTYHWYVPWPSSGQVCVQAMGFRRVTLPPWRWNGHFYVRQYSYDVRTNFSGGCGRSGYVTVPWNNVMAYPQIRAASQVWSGVPVAF
jgi:hypothetical protein